MKKILEYGTGVFCWLNALVCCAAEKFEVLPDLPDPLAAYAQTAEASSVSGKADYSSLVGTQSVGHELSFVSAFFALLLTIVLIYLFVIILSKFNKANIKLMKQQQRELSKFQASVVSTTALGNNKTLHVIELDGKRMLIGASQSTIQLIKDLGAVSADGAEEEFSHIEIPTIKIPKIEIPSIGFSKLATKIHKEFVKNESDTPAQNTENPIETDIQENKEEENPEGIIDSLFTKSETELDDEQESEKTRTSEHIVDPDEYALYKKYLG